MPAPRRKRKSVYLNKRDILAQVILSKEQDMTMTAELVKMLTLLTSKYAKTSNFARYTFNDDMQAYAMMMLVKNWYKFNEEKSDNPFAFYTQCIKNSFIQYLNKEKKQRNIRDELLLKQGMSPSLNYLMEYNEKQAAAAQQNSDDVVYDDTGTFDNKHKSV